MNIHYRPATDHTDILRSMQGKYNQVPHQSSVNMLGSATVTPCGPGTRTSIEREWIARCTMRRDAAEKYEKAMRGSGGGYNVSPIDRKEVSNAV